MKYRYSEEADPTSTYASQMVSNLGPMLEQRARRVGHERHDDSGVFYIAVVANGWGHPPDLPPSTFYASCRSLSDDDGSYQEPPSSPYEINWCDDGSIWIRESVRVGSTEAVLHHFDEFLDDLAGGRAARSGSQFDHRIRAEIEVFVKLWNDIAASVPLTRDERRVSRALIELVSEASKADDPPNRVLREAFRWFAGKVDIFADEFARSAGAATGKAVAVGAGVLVSGKLPELVQVLQGIQHYLGG